MSVGLCAFDCVRQLDLRWRRGKHHIMAGKSLAVVQGRCHGRSSCTVVAATYNFGDPCSDASKYLSVDYSCVADTTYSNAITCLGGTQVLTCAGGNVLSISSAVFGRMDISPCDAINTTSFSCGAVNSLYDVRNKCSGLTSCAINVTTAQFGDPCMTIGGKYLPTHYRADSL